MVRTVAAQARKAIVKAVRRSAHGIRTVAGEAAGAAAQAATGVVLESTANALEAGPTEVTQSAPAVKRTLGRAAKRAIGGRNHASSARKRSAKATRARINKRTARKKAAPRRKAKRRSR